ncbi:MAG TPA: wax ester/triacylglycerol synthase family O-acyltransferase, partial [Thermoanaerobaculia bacterium]
PEDTDEIREPLSAVDHAWLRMDDPTNLMIISGVLVMDEPVELDRIKAILRRRLLPIQRFHQRIVHYKDDPFWKDDPEFDLDQHVHRVDLPEPGDDSVLREVVSDLMSEALPSDRPLWSFHLLNRYKGRGCVVMARLHHCIGDGMALLLVLLSLTDLTLDGPAGDTDGDFDDNPFTDLFRKPPRGIEAAKQLAERIMPDGMRLLQQSAEAYSSMNAMVTGVASTTALGRLVLRPSDPATIYKGPLGVPKRVAWSDPIPVAEIKEIGKALKGTVNDVLLSAMTGGLRRYLVGRGQKVKRLNFRAAMPVNLRSLEEMSNLGNQFGLIFLSLPVGIEDPVRRLAELHRRSMSLKRSAEPIVVYNILKLLGASPDLVQKIVVDVFAAKTTAVMTNVPGPREVLYLAGHPIKEIFFWVPQSGRVGLGISIFSYDGHVRMGLASDAGLVPDPESIVRGFHEEYEELRARAARA